MQNNTEQSDKRKSQIAAKRKSAKRTERSELREARSYVGRIVK